MKMDAIVSVESFESDLLEELVKQAEQCDEIFSEIADIVLHEAQTTAAFTDRTGNLRGSIRKLKSKYDNGGYIVVASGGKGKGAHAHLVEFGHIKWLWGQETSEKVPANPFMRPALEKGIAQASSIIQKYNG